MNPDSVMDAQLQNWENFCRHHAIGDWYGTWTIYDPEGEVTDSFKCVRSLHVSVDGREINHQNHYIYADGKTKTETYGPYKKPITRGLYLDNSFSWGSTEIKSGSTFFFETGFRHEDRRGSAIARYDESGRLECILIIPEHLRRFAEKPSHPPVNQLSGYWRGTLTRMTPNWIVSPKVATSWIQLEDMSENYLMLHLTDSVSTSFPRQIESGKEFFVAVDWLVNPTLLQRGIRNFDTSGFTGFTLEVFTHES